jgi:hypothetical protein
MLEVDETFSDLPVARLKIVDTVGKGPKIGPKLGEALTNHRPILVDLAEMHSASFIVGYLNASELQPTSWAMGILVAAHVAACRAELPIAFARVSRRWFDLLRLAKLDVIFLRPFYDIRPMFRSEVFECLGRLFLNELLEVDAAATSAELLDGQSERDFKRRYGMPSSDLRDRFRESTSPRDYRRFSDSIVSSTHDRLRFWQDRIWERFCGSCLAAPTETSDVRFAIATRCTLHECRTRHDWRRGCALQLHHWDILTQAHYPTTMSIFPFAQGPLICPKCVTARLRWLTERVPELLV